MIEHLTDAHDRVTLAAWLIALALAGATAVIARAVLVTL